jgi:LexA DNA binding domain
MPRRPLLSELQALDLLEEWMEKFGMAPTVAEFTQALGVGSTRTAMRYLRKLEARGLIQRWHGARGIKLAKPRRKDPPADKAGWREEFDSLFVTRRLEGFTYELLDPDDLKNFIRRTIGEVIAEVSDPANKRALVLRWL